jgi:hypothetical protein
MRVKVQHSSSDIIVTMNEPFVLDGTIKNRLRDRSSGDHGIALTVSSIDTIHGKRNAVLGCIRGHNLCVHGTPADEESGRQVLMSPFDPMSNEVIAITVPDRVCVMKDDMACCYDEIKVDDHVRVECVYRGMRISLRDHRYYEEWGATRLSIVVPMSRQWVIETPPMVTTTDAESSTGVEPVVEPVEPVEPVVEPVEHALPHPPTPPKARATQDPSPSSLPEAKEPKKVHFRTEDRMDHMEDRVEDRHDMERLHILNFVDRLRNNNIPRPVPQRPSHEDLTQISGISGLMVDPSLRDLLRQPKSASNDIEAE